MVHRDRFDQGEFEGYVLCVCPAEVIGQLSPACCITVVCTDRRSILFL